jgi:asparagine synthase (glutamine-hydrolysing)
VDIPAGLSELEFCLGTVVGEDPLAPALPHTERSDDEVCAGVLEPALAGGRCVVWLTGDAGSIMVLRAAVRTARSAGLPMPIAASLSFGSERVHEKHQEKIVRALGIDDWLRIPVGSELSLLGSRSQEVLRGHGVAFPISSHLILPILDAARGGTFVEGYGLDELWLHWRGAQLATLLTGRQRPRRGDLRTLLALAPASYRRRLVQRVVGPRALEHLRPQVWPAAVNLFGAMAGGRPLTASATIEHMLRRRCGRLTRDRFRTLAKARDVELVSFLVPDVMAALARRAGRRGWRGRVEMLADLAPDLPAPPRGMPGMPWRPFWAVPEVSDFIERWDGTGLDLSYIDPEGLRQAWRRHDANTGMLLQAAWLAEDAQQRFAPAPPVARA